MYSTPHPTPSDIKSVQNIVFKNQYLVGQKGFNNKLQATCKKKSVKTAEVKEEKGKKLSCLMAGSSSIPMEKKHT